MASQPKFTDIEELYHQSKQNGDVDGLIRVMRLEPELYGELVEKHLRRMKQTPQ